MSEITENIINTTGSIVLGGAPVASAAIDKIAAALSKAQSDMKIVVKNLEGKVSGVSKSGKHYEYTYKYAGLDAVWEAIREVEGPNGLALVQRFFQGDFLHTILLHSSGQWIDYGLYPLGKTDEHQKRGSAISYARRYVASCVYGIAPEEDDGGQVGNEMLGQDGNYSGASASQPNRNSTGQQDRLKAYNAAKAEYVISAVRPDGTLDYDEFAAILEGELISAADMNHISMLKKANAKTLNAMKDERPDLFDHVKNLFTQHANTFA